MTGTVFSHSMRTAARSVPFLLVLALASPRPSLAEEQPLPADVAAAHAEGKWTIRLRDLYAYLVQFYGQTPTAKPILPDLIQRAFVQDEARRLGVLVTEKDVTDWLDVLDREMREKTGGATDLQAYMKEQGMAMPELRRRARIAMLRERVARAHIAQKDPTRPKDKKLAEDSVTLVIDDLLAKARAETDRTKLPEGVVARIGSVDIAEYDYGRELSFALPATELARALNDLILVEETRLLIGNDDPPSDLELAIQKSWFVEYERNRLAREIQGKHRITDEMIAQSLQARGLTLDLCFSNPSFRAQARAKGYFRRSIDQETLRKYYEDHKDRYGDELKVARILVAARAQQVAIAGKKMRTLDQGKALADALWLRATQGADFAQLAAENSDDPDVIRKNGGVVPYLISAASPGYEDTYVQANTLAIDGIGKPWFSQGRGYVIVKLLERKAALGFDAMAHDIQRDAAEERYRTWKVQVIRAARRSEKLLG